MLFQLTKGFMGTLYFQVAEEICTYVIKWHRITHTQYQHEIPSLNIALYYVRRNHWGYWVKTTWDLCTV